MNRNDKMIAYETEEELLNAKGGHENYYFHATPKANAKGIEEHGLLLEKKHKDFKAIYLGNNLDSCKALMNNYQSYVVFLFDLTHIINSQNNNFNVSGSTPNDQTIRVGENIAKEHIKGSFEYYAAI